MEVNSVPKPISYHSNNYQEWFISALKSSKGESLEENNLVQNCINCHNEVKKLLEKSDLDWISKYYEFRLNATIILLLGCPSVKSVTSISSSKDLQSLIKSLPTINETHAFLVIQKLKNYIFLRGILPWLPFSTLSNLISNYFSLPKDVSPLSLAISFELLYAVANSVMFEREIQKQEIINMFDIFLKFFMSKVEHKFNTEQEIKSEAYFFLYLFETLFIYFNLIATKLTEDSQTFALGLQLKNLYIKSTKVFPEYLEEIFEDFINKLAVICCQIIPFISCNIWIDWHGFKLPQLDLPNTQLNKKDESEDINKSVQLEISHLAFKIDKLILNCVGSNQVLCAPEFQELKSFIKHIAIDPDHDSDFDYSNEELIKLINTDGDKRKKLINILFNRDQIFESSECLLCLKNYGMLVKKDIVISLLLKLITAIKNNSTWNEDWKQVILNIAKNCSTEDHSQIIRRDLKNGMNNLLMTSSFNQDVTFIFNQLSESDNYEHNVLFSWLCLQDGKEVVKLFVKHVLALTGLASIAASVLKSVYFICQAEEPKARGSILTICLQECLEEARTEIMKKEFQLLVLKLLEKPHENEIQGHGSDAQLYKDILPIQIHEVLDHLVLPKIHYEDDIDPCLPLCIEILKTIVDLYPECLMEASPKFTSLIISLTLLYNNCCFPKPMDYSSKLTLRNSIQYILVTLIEQVYKNKSDYCKVISFVKNHLSTTILHARCLLLLSPIVEISVSDSLLPNEDIFLHIFCGSTGPLFVEQISKDLPNYSRMEWVWSLSIHLPNCNFEEWTQAFQLTYEYLNQPIQNSRHRLVVPTLKLFQEVLFLICAATCSFENLQDNTNSEECNISVDYCFKSFSLGAAKFIKERIAEESSEQQFFILISIFNWWCRSFKGFTCNPELPSIFLSSLSNLLLDLFSSESLTVIFTKESNYSGNRKCNKNKECDIENSGDQHSHPEIETNGASFRSKSEFITNLQFIEKFEYLVKSFIVHVPANTVGASVAGKLKSLYERNYLNYV